MRRRWTVMPTLWGYALLGDDERDDDVPRHPAWRVDVLLPPVLTPDEIADLHAGLRKRVTGRGRVATLTFWSPRIVRRALRDAVEIRTSDALAPARPVTAPTLLVAGLVRQLVRADDVELTVTQEALARELAWSAVRAARSDDHVATIEGVRALGSLLRPGSPSARRRGESAAGWQGEAA